MNHFSGYKFCLNLRGSIIFHETLPNPVLATRTLLALCEAMRLLRRCDTGGFSLTQFGAEATASYAILSDTGGADTEVTFEDLKNGTHV